MENIISPQTTSTSSPAAAVDDQLPPPCSTCVKYHESIKDSISQLDQKMNLILSKMEEIISTTTVSAATKQQTVTDAIGSGPSKSSTSLSPQHDATRSATEDDEGTDLIYPTKKNGNFNGSANGNVRKRRQEQQQSAQNVAPSKLSKQEHLFEDHDSSSFNTSMPVLTEQNACTSPSMTNQQLLDSLTLATVLSGTEGNNEVLNAFFQSALYQNDPNILMNVLNASIQDGNVSGFMPEAAPTPATIKKRAPRKSSSKQAAAAASPTVMPSLLSNVKVEDLNEEQREALDAEGGAASQQCSNCFATKTSAWRRNPDGQLICNACGLYYRMHQTNRPIYLRKNHIQTRYRKKNGAISGESSPMMMSSMDDENDLSSSFINGYEMLLGTATMAK